MHVHADKLNWHIRYDGKSFMKRHHITGFTTLPEQETEAVCEAAGDGVKQ